mmetsp:Transcript_5824/g.14533  ORF Transcript_5824/g.14533 Transcript_5824/m.14533 type:complete len:118 (+) Transcript_5824:249-602(+)
MDSRVVVIGVGVVDTAEDEETVFGGKTGFVSDFEFPPVFSFSFLEAQSIVTGDVDDVEDIGINCRRLVAGGMIRFCQKAARAKGIHNEPAIVVAAASSSSGNKTTFDRQIMYAHNHK